MKVISSLKTTVLLMAVLLITNLCAVLTSIYLNKNFAQVADACKIEEDRGESPTILANETFIELPPKADNKPQATPAPPFHRLILRAAQQHALDPALLRAVIMTESSYNPNAVSKKGARGLMQLMPRTAAELGVMNSFDPEQNINGGARYLRQLMDRFDNDVQLALAAYNAGSRYVRKYNGVPPFRETRLYIKKVINYRTLYQENQSIDNQMV